VEQQAAVLDGVQPLHAAALHLEPTRGLLRQQRRELLGQPARDRLGPQGPGLVEHRHLDATAHGHDGVGRPRRGGQQQDEQQQQSGEDAGEHGRA